MPYVAAPIVASLLSCDRPHQRPGPVVVAPTLRAASGLVADTSQEVLWLANANLAADPTARAQLDAASLDISPNGAMDYSTAQAWIRRLNAHEYLGHNDWQLPVVPPTDPTCAVAAGTSGNSYGPSCTGSALGRLYAVGLGARYPASVPHAPIPAFPPLVALHPAMYWSGDHEGDGAGSFSFSSGIKAQNTTKYNYFHVLPRLTDVNPSHTGTGVVANADGLTVYDANTGITWIRAADYVLRDPAAASLRRQDSDLRSGSRGIEDVDKIDADGKMRWATAKKWVGLHPDWMLPSRDDLETLMADLGLEPGNRALMPDGVAGPFEDLQPFFYWACPRDQDGDSRSGCNGHIPGPNPNHTKPMEWCFNQDQGFQGTAESEKRFHVLPYVPAPEGRRAIPCPEVQIFASDVGLLATSPLAPEASSLTEKQLTCELRAPRIREMVHQERKSRCADSVRAELLVDAPWMVESGGPSGIAGDPTTGTPMSVELTRDGPPEADAGGGFRCTYESAGRLTATTVAPYPIGWTCASVSPTAFGCRAP